MLQAPSSLSGCPTLSGCPNSGRWCQHGSPSELLLHIHGGDGAPWVCIASCDGRICIAGVDPTGDNGGEHKHI